LHFERPIFRAQHYLGWALDVDARVAIHQRGRGARLVRQALAAGISVELVRIWPEADQKRERSLKRGGLKRYCPSCHHAALKA
jgi:predicted GIY-YIG superfamily endonuclease